MSGERIATVLICHADEPLHADGVARWQWPTIEVPAEALKVGTMLLAQGPGGQGMPVRVHEIKDKTVVMDFNHPLAGKTLSFDVRITDIKDPAK